MLVGVAFWLAVPGTTRAFSAATGTSENATAAGDATFPQSSSSGSSDAAAHRGTLIGSSASTHKSIASLLLREARESASRGDMAAARRLAERARVFPVQWGPMEESPAELITRLRTQSPAAVRQVSATCSHCVVPTPDGPSSSDKKVVCRKQDRRYGLLRRLLRFDARPHPGPTRNKTGRNTASAALAHHVLLPTGTCPHGQESTSKALLALKAIPTVESGTTETRRQPRSSVLAELEKLYRREGKQMPAMNLSRKPPAQHIVSTSPPATEVKMKGLSIRAKVLGERSARTAAKPAVHRSAKDLLGNLFPETSEVEADRKVSSSKGLSLDEETFGAGAVQTSASQASESGTAPSPFDGGLDRAVRKVERATATTTIVQASASASRCVPSSPPRCAATNPVVSGCPPRCGHSAGGGIRPPCATKARFLCDRCRSVTWQGVSKPDCSRTCMGQANRPLAGLAPAYWAGYR